MSEVDTFFRALGARYLMLIGIAGMAVAAYLVGAGLLDVANGSWFPRSGGGLSSVGFGAMFGANAVWLGWRGLRVHRESEAEK